MSAVKVVHLLRKNMYSLRNLKKIQLILVEESPILGHFRDLALTLMSEDAFISLSFLDEILSADFLSKISTLCWR